MATNLQVNASTSQAVGAFDALANSISKAKGSFENLTAGVSKANTTFRGFGTDALSNVSHAFNSLTTTFDIFMGALTAVSAGIQLVFNSLLRELDKIQGFNAIMSVTTKSTVEAGEAFAFIRETANRLGQPIDALTNNYAKLVSALPEGTTRLQTAEKAFLGIAMAARTLHASNQDTQLMFYAITQIASKGVVSMEELRRQLGEKLPGAISIAARSINTSVADMIKAISKGTVDSAKFLPYFGDELIRTFQDSSEKASRSVSASINRLTNVWVDFVKEVLDSGAGQSIINVFDALREKLSDPYLISRFAELVKYLADKFTDFIKNLTTDDIRKGFDTFTNGVDLMIKIIGKLITAFTWIINNTGKVGAILGGAMGAIAGATVGLAAGPLGAVVGGVLGGTAGAAAGGYAGSKLSQTPEQAAASANQDATARLAAETQRLNAENLKYTQMIPLLTQFKALKGLQDVPGLMKQEMLTQKSLDKVSEILTSTKYKTDQQRADALITYSKTGIELGPRGTLKDVLGANTKKDPEVQKTQNAMMKGFGLEPTFYDDWNRLIKLFKSGKINLDELTDAQTRLLSKQPVIEQNVAKNKKAQDEMNRELNTAIDLAFKQVTVKEKVARQLDDEQRVAGLTREDAQREADFNKYNNEYAQAGITLRKDEVDVLKERIDLIQTTKDITAAENGILDQTVDKYITLINQQKALNKAIAEKKLTPEQASQFTANADPNMQGSGTWIAAQSNALTDYYAYIKGLRNSDRIDEETALQAKSKAAADYNQKVTAAFLEAANVRLQAGNGSWADGMLASLQKVQAGFTSFAAGTAQQFGQLFSSFTDGFANAIGRSIVYSENLKDGLHKAAQEGLAALISGLIKLGIQWLINAALGKSIAATSLAAGVAMSVAAATATATAWAPAAALVSLASYGANSVPASAGILATTGVSQGVAALSLAGLQTGGYTGDKGISEPAGIVHGKEFVINADATLKHRPLLEAINSGRDFSDSSVQRLINRATKGYMTGGYVGNDNFSMTTALLKSDSPQISVQLDRPKAEPKEKVESTKSEKPVTPQLNQKIINLIDPNLIKDYLQTADGEQTVINIIRRNPETIKSSING